jgi:hypothetical protein
MCLRLQGREESRLVVTAKEAPKKKLWKIAEKQKFGKFTVNLHRRSQPTTSATGIRSSLVYFMTI